jgi:hypothetical protein
MQALTRRRVIFWGALSLVGGCASSEQVDELARQLKKLRDQFDEQQNELRGMKTWYDEQIRKLWSQVKCDKEQVREFVRGCELADSATCTPTAAANALAFMDSQPYAMMHIRPGTSVRRMHSIRRGQLVQLLALHNMRPSTKFLILIQPRSDSIEDKRDTEQIGATLVNEMRYTLRVPPGVPIIGPYMLPCKLKREQVQHYGSQLDKPLPSEPPNNEPHVRIWVFSTDC